MKSARDELDRLIQRFERDVSASARAEVARIAAPLAKRADRIAPAMRRTARAMGVTAMPRKRVVRSTEVRARNGATATIDARLFLDPARTREVLAKLAKERGLARRHVEVLSALVAGVPRARVADVLGIGDESVKTYVKLILKRVRRRDLVDAVWWIRNLIAEQPDRSRIRRRRAQRHR